jgi:hypothetical protein
MSNGGLSDEAALQWALRASAADAVASTLRTSGPPRSASVFHTTARSASRPGSVLSEHQPVPAAPLPVPRRRLIHTVKAVARLTKRGHVEKIVRETYLQPRVACHLPQCRLGCPRPAAAVSGLRSDASHILVPDAATLLRFLEILELSDWDNIVLLQSVVEEFNRVASARAYNRLIKFTKDIRRACVAFPNERFATTFVARRNGESRSARNARACACAVAWFGQHARSQSSSSPPMVVALCSDERQRAAFDASAQV